MCKKRRFTVPFNRQHGKRTQTVFKSKWRHPSDNSWWMPRQLSLTKFLLVICKIFRLFLNTFTADDKYFLLNRDNLTQPIQMQLSVKEKTFSYFFSEVLISRLNFKHFQKKMTLTANVFWKFQTPKIVVR